jgi:hypothetical protein
MVNPKYLCTKHLLGTHVEMHMLLGHLKRQRQINKYITNNCLEPLSLNSYHDAVAAEMTTRGFNHKTQLTYSEDIFQYLPSSIVEYIVDSFKSLIDLLTRCKKCSDRYEEIHSS